MKNLTYLYYFRPFGKLLGTPSNSPIKAAVDLQQ